VAGYFKDPAGFSKGAHGVLKSGVGPGGAMVPPPTSGPTPGAEETKRGESERAALEATAASLRQKLFHEEHFTQLKDKIQIEIAEEGLRISLVEAGEGVFFDVGSAAVKPATREVVTIIAREVGRLPNEVVVEGHTDSRPYVGAPNYTNWELSADRANAARRILEASGLRPKQVAHVMGYADRHLGNPSDPFDASNRRISIIVRFRGDRSQSPAGTALPPPR
jgi:chemotaxis protein MotB